MYCEIELLSGPHADTVRPHRYTCAAEVVLLAVVGSITVLSGAQHCVLNHAIFPARASLRARQALNAPREDTDMVRGYYPHPLSRAGVHGRGYLGQLLPRMSLTPAIGAPGVPLPYGRMTIPSVSSSCPSFRRLVVFAAHHLSIDVGTHACARRAHSPACSLPSVARATTHILQHASTCCRGDVPVLVRPQSAQRRRTVSELPVGIDRRVRRA